jgi:hypothetical protein
VLITGVGLGVRIYHHMLLAPFVRDTDPLIMNTEQHTEFQEFRRNLADAINHVYLFLHQEFLEAAYACVTNFSLQLHHDNSAL